MEMRTMAGKAEYRTGAADRETTVPARVSSALVIPARGDLLQRPRRGSRHCIHDGPDPGTHITGQIEGTLCSYEFAADRR
jgi:hypothetical protein